MQDKLDSLRDSAAAVAILGAGARDDVLVHGRYMAVCVGPQDDYREEYVRIRDELVEAEIALSAVEDAQIGSVGEAMSLGLKRQISMLQRQLSAIPMEEKWSDEFDNLVTTVGKNDLLDKYLNGAAYTQTIRMGLAGTGTKAAADTQASHAGWLEVGLANAPTYTGNRKDVVMGAAAAGVSTSPAQAFAITSAGTIAGCFINNGGSATKDDTTGVLFSAGNFTAGDRVVQNGDTVNVTYALAA